MAAFHKITSSHKSETHSMHINMQQTPQHMIGKTAQDVGVVETYCGVAPYLVVFT